MNKKIKLLFVIESLTLGGAEKSLITLLNHLDYEKYDVDLQLFSYHGSLQKYVPKEVTLLPSLTFFQYTSVSYKYFLKKLCRPIMLVSQVIYSMKLRLFKSTNIEKAVFFWKSCSKCFIQNDITYDVAIAYAQGIPTFYVADKIKANSKIAWVNSDYNPMKKVIPYIVKKYNKFDYINLVSKESLNKFKVRFPFIRNKLVMIKDIIDYQLIEEMAKENPLLKLNYNSGTKILTVGRLSPQKGYELLVDSAYLLKQKDVNFVWYIIGEGKERKKIEKKIVTYDLIKNVILLGAKENPYPYFKNCDLYVQTSLYEGYCITVSEAKIFNKAIISTNFDAIYSQIVDKETGLITNKDADSIADTIIEVITDTKLKIKLTENLKKEMKGNYQELDLFQELIDKCMDKL